jgi:DNA-binding CsgD family transcriptional regulator
MNHIPSTDFNVHIIEAETRKVKVAYGVTFAQPEIREPYFAWRHSIVPLLNHSLPAMRTCCISRSYHECPPDKFDETEFHQEWLRKQEFFHTLHLDFVVLGEAGLNANIGLARPKGMGIYKDEEESLLRFLKPHFQRAFRIASFISELSDKDRVLAEALDKLPQGVIVVSRDCHVLFINSSAKRITDAKDGISIDRQQKLQAVAVQCVSQLRKLIETAIRTRLGGQPNHSGVIQLDRSSGLRPLSLLVSPLTQDMSDLDFRQPAALVFIADPESKIETGEQIMRRLYQLTPAEARLTLLLAQGKSVIEASKELKVTANTTRTHLKRIFQKTGAKRQSDLVKLLVSSPAIFK